MYQPIINEMRNHCRKQGTLKPCQDRPLPRRGVLIKCLHDLKSILFPGFFSEPLSEEEASIKLQETLEALNREIKVACSAESKDCLHVTEPFLKELPKIHALTLLDIEAAVRRDPSAKSAEEVLLSYPGILAVLYHRIAHFFYRYKVPMIPRIISEYAHGKTGIDIHPGATIGKSFFIDHGTGVVIGETSVIGDKVTLYQGVTIGAKHIYEDLDPTIKRHPTIEDSVVIYAGATILGGDTVVGEGSLIGGNVFLTHSVDPYSTVTTNIQADKIIRKKVQK